jgi:urea transport system ATP-binding protein
MQATRWQPAIFQQIGRVIGYLRGRGDLAIVRVEQYSDFAHALADRFPVLKRGAVVALCGSKAGMPQAGLRAAVSV